MFLKIITKNGISRLYLYESYFKNGKSNQRCLEALGTLDELMKKYDDPIAYFKQYALEKTEARKADSSAMIPIDRNEELEIGEDDAKNVGYGIIKRLYKELQLDIFWRQITARRHMKYDMEKIFCLLVISRILYPGSKKYTFENRNVFFEDFKGFDLEDIYNSLDVINENKDALQKWIFERSEKISHRDLSVSYFDCTNYYFDISHPDLDLLDDEGNPVDEEGNRTAAKYRKRGPEKNHRPDPIVEMGLLMDRNGIPIAYDLFPGNESEKLHMRPIINRVKTQFSDSRVIFVADRGLNTSDNIYYLNGDNRGDVNLRDGYVYGQSVRGADAEFKEWVLKSGYKKDTLIDDDGQKILFIHKSRIHLKELHVNVTKPGQKKPAKKTVRVDQKQMVYYSYKYAKRQKINRDAMVERAKDLISHPKKYDKITAAGSASYIINIAFNKNTGEIVEGKNLELDLAKIEEEEKYDGYYSIVTSELKMSDLEMQEVYRGLSRIEETFKISKTDFESRPIHVRLDEHIDGHFATCFTALVLIRLLQTKTGWKYPVGKMLESLRKYNCINLDTNNWKFIYYDEILKACGEAFDMKLSSKYHTQLEIRRLLHY